MTTKRHKYLNTKSYQTRWHQRDDKEHKEMQNDYKKTSELQRNAKCRGHAMSSVVVLSLSVWLPYN